MASGSLAQSSGTGHSANEGLESVKKPVEQARHLPGYLYSDSKLLDLEKQKIFMKDWLCVAREEELEKIGDFMTFDILGEPLLLTRDENGEAGKARYSGADEGTARSIRARKNDALLKPLMGGNSMASGSLAQSSGTGHSANEGLESVKKPVEQARHLPGYLYSDSKLLDLEKQKIFMKDWLCVAREEELEKIGDFMTFDILGEPLLLTRDENGALNALVNMCSHRGVEVADGSGNAKEFSCPYHGWLYDLEGKLIGASTVFGGGRGNSTIHTRQKKRRVVETINGRKFDGERQFGAKLGYGPFS